MLKPALANARIDTAMTENESNAPTIQRTTRAILLEITGGFGAGGDWGSA
jgi:hypothetical protein